jgi:hypothetical protein
MPRAAYGNMRMYVDIAMRIDAAIRSVQAAI